MPLPSTLGKYHLEREVGRGGFAVVCLAHDPTLGRRVAIKVPHAWLLTDPKFVERFRREARLAANLSHPHIVTIYEIGEEQGTPFIAMEWLEGMLFQDWLRQMQPTPQAALQALTEVGAALDYAHARGVVHRDIKPSNVMIVAGRGGVLTDFGIARSLAQATQSTSSVMGTPNYMAPEVLRGQPATAATDIYALGVMLYQILAGRLPFQGETVEAVAYQHVNEPPPDPRRFNPGLSLQTVALLLQALAKDPRQRPTSAVGLIQGLMGGQGANADKPAHTPPPVPKQLQRRRWPLFLASVLILIAIVQLSWWALNRPTVNQEPTLMIATSTRPPTSTLAPLPPMPIQATTAPTATDTLLPIDVEPTLPPTATETPLLIATEPLTSPIPADTPIPIDTPTPLPDATVNSATLNMRSGPGTNYDRLGSYARGASVRVLGRNPAGDWLLVQAGDGQQGWMAAALLTVNLDQAAVALAAIPPTPTPRPAPAGADMVFVPAGEFLMGSSDWDPIHLEQFPQHTVYLDAFWIDKTEVTNAQYQRCVSTGVCGQSRNVNSSNLNAGDQPVAGVSWHDAAAYCGWIGRRLPTEAEWEKAARGTDGRIYPWGNGEPTCSLANYSFCAGDHTEVVGSHPAGASPYGALDMAGSVWEWVADWYQADYYASSPAQNPRGPATGEIHLARGGSWLYYPYSGERSAFRGTMVPSDGIGFRCARSP